MISRKTREKTVLLLREFGIKPKKSLGQNFLVSDRIISKILHQVQLLGPGSLIEIGPGLGGLTEGLCKMPAALLLLELDAMLSRYWRDRGFTVDEGDALHWDWSKTEDWTRPRVLVSNLPYQISSTLVIDRTLDQSLDFMVLMFQKEVAQRIKASLKTKEYGMLSVFSQIFWKIEWLLDVGHGEFLPPPKVDSRVLLFQAQEISIKNREHFLRFLKASFLQPRKLMISNMIQGLGLFRETLLSAFESLQFKPSIRPQEVSPTQFAALYLFLYPREKA